jgi:hypothetical protein
MTDSPASTVTTIDLDRVVAVLGRTSVSEKPIQRGSGFLVSDRFVLTAWHCTVDRRADDRPDLTLSAVRLLGGATADANRVAFSRELDLAVLELTPHSDQVWPEHLEPVVYGSVSRRRTVELVGSSAVGYPSWKTDQGRKTHAQTIGTIRTAEGAASGHLILRDHLLENVGTQPANGEPSLWSGLSGALVFHGDLALGVITEHRPADGRSALVVQPVAILGSSKSNRGNREELNDLAQSLGIRPTLRLPTARRVPIQDLRNRLHTSHQRQLETLVERLPSQTRWSGSPIRELWNSWSQQRHWRDHVESHLAAVADAIQRGEVKATRPLPEATSNATYSSIRRSLQAAQFDRWRTLTRDGVSADRQVSGASRSLRWLADQAREPQFNQCFAITGRWGSGKTRLLTEIVGLASASLGRHAVILAVDGPTPVRDSLLQTVSRLFGTALTSLDELSDFLETYLLVDLHLLVDDLHTAARQAPQRAAQVRELISETSRCPRIRWVVTANASELDSVLVSDGASSMFWADHGLDSNHQFGDLGGWLDLDRANEDRGVGLAILADVAGHRGAAERGEIRADRRTFADAYRVLSVPIAGWLRGLDLNSDHGRESPLDDVNEAAFVTTWWRLRLAGIDRVGLDQPQLEAAVLGVCEAYRSAIGWPLSTAELSRSINRQLSDSAVPSPLANIAIGVLKRSGLLEPIPGPRGFGQAERLDFGDPSFWGYWIGQELANTTTDAASGEHQGLVAVGRWTQDPVRDSPLGIAILQSWITARAAQLEEDGVDAEPLVVACLIASFPPVPLLGAGLAGSAKFRARLSRALVRHPLGMRNKRERFALVRYIASAEDDAFDAATRIELIQQYFTQLGTDGLASYIGFAVRAVLGNDILIVPLRFVELLRSLLGTEGAGVAGVAAAQVVRAGLRAHGNGLKPVIDATLEFARRANDKAEFRASIRTAQQRIRDLRAHRSTRSDWEQQSTYWELLFREVAEHTVERHGIASFDYLNGCGWHSADLDGAPKFVADTLRRSSTLALGGWYRQHRFNEEHADSYSQLIKDLVSFPPEPLKVAQCRKEAVYLIRHSSATYGKDRVEVDSRFHPILAYLAFDEHARKSHHLRSLCEANGIFYPDRIRTNPDATSGSGPNQPKRAGRSRRRYRNTGSA